MISPSNFVALGHMSRCSTFTCANSPNASVEEAVVLVVAGVLRARALPGLPEGVLLAGHRRGAPPSTSWRGPAVLGQRRFTGNRSAYGKSLILTGAAAQPRK